MAMKTYRQRQGLKGVKQEATEQYLERLEEIVKESKNFRTELLRLTNKMVEGNEKELQKAKNQFKSREKTITEKEPRNF